MNIGQAIRERRSVKKFTDRDVSRDVIESLLSAAVLAPNHHLTQPWRFYVLGPNARHAYGLALGARKARKIPDAGAGRKVIETVAGEHRALPCMIAVAMTIDENAEKREEDYAAVMMATENFLLAAVAEGLGTHLKTGAVMEDPAARAAAGVLDGERIVAIVNAGYPAEIPPAKTRLPASAHTTWLD
jgi:nitroreductase